MKVLFLDIARSTGWASGDGTGTPQWGTIELPRTNEELGPFLVAADTAFSLLCDRQAPDLIAFEAPVLGRKTSLITARRLYSLAGKIEEIAYRRARPCVEANLQDIRTHFLGRGRPRDRKRVKIAVCNRCRDLGWKIRTDDEADALAGLDYVLALQSPAAAIMRTPLFMKAGTDGRQKGAGPGPAQAAKGLEVGRRKDAPGTAAPRPRTKRRSAAEPVPG